MCMYDDTAIHDRVIYPSELRNLQSGHAIKMRKLVKLTITNPSQVQIGNMRYWCEQQGI